jgi:predicted ATP-grasp superfamily ATP-dependent carboligase
LIGMTRQLVGEEWLHARPFRYCGSIGPLPVDDRLRGKCQRLGEVIARSCALRGIFGVDFVAGDKAMWPIEVNPRYPASVEILELAMGSSALAAHCKVFNRTLVSTSLSRAFTHVQILGKAIIFAPDALHFPMEGPWSAACETDNEPAPFPHYADIPYARERIEARQPVITAFAEGASVDDCAALLRLRARELYELGCNRNH